MGKFATVLGKPNKPVIEKEADECLGYSKPTLVIRNSFCSLAAFPSDIKSDIKKLLTYHDEGITYELKKLYSLVNYWNSQNRTRAAYGLKAKIKILKEREIVCWLKGNSFPTGHMNMVIDLLKERRFHDFDLKDLRELPSNSETYRLRNTLPELRYYQKEMVEVCLKENRGVLEAAVGCGKTLIFLKLIKELSVRTLIIIPSVALQEQWEREITFYFGRDKVCSVNATSVRKDKKLAPIRLTTIQTLTSLIDTGDISKVVGDIDLLICEEFHHFGSESATNLLPYIENIYFRFGGTGSFLRNDYRTLDMLGFISNRLYHYPAWKATEEGYLTPSEYIIKKIEGVSAPNYVDEYNLNYCVKSQKGKIRGGENLIPAITQIVKDVPNNEQIFILVDRKDNCGKVISETLKFKGFDNFFISGDDKKEIIVDTIEAYNKKDIRILIGSAVVGEGIDLYSAQHLILANGGKSPIKLVQAIGRCVRLSEDKKKSYVYDFSFEGSKYLKKHCEQRINIYNSNFAGEVKWT